MKALVTGGAGVLGSNLTKLLYDKGFDVRVIDVVRKEEAWRLKEIMDKINYVWKSSFDVETSDVKDVDLIIDSAIGFADRPFGLNSPKTTVLYNILPSLGTLEAVKKLEKKPLMIYPSSFNVFYGEEKVIREDSKLSPSSVYGFTKACTELLYYTYYKSYGVPIIITRVGSAYGPKGRSDELPHRLIIYCLKGREFYLRSPESKRLWTYSKDVLSFYDKLIEKSEELIGYTLHCAGNKKDEIITNTELAKRISKIVGKEMKITYGSYDIGELINGKPVNFEVDCSFTRKLLNWKPKYSLDEGLKETVEWFKENIDNYG